MLSIQEVHLDELLSRAYERRATDVHLTVGLPPMVRIDGELQPTEYDALTPHDTQRLVYDILTDGQIERFEQTHELDMSYPVPQVARFRFNIYRQRGSVGGAARSIPTEIPDLEELSLPPILRDLTQRNSGLILVTGPTGSGKSTSLASMVNIINESRPLHIVTIENPIEYLHRHKRAMVNQREIGTDTDSFSIALRSALREDPDVILVGEMRDLETIENALIAAETGHLVFATLHTRNAPQAIDRIIDVFPAQQQEQIRVMLANTVEAVVAQRLLARLGAPGRIPSIEIMVATSAIRNLIREAKTHLMMGAIEIGGEYGMQTMDRSLAELFMGGLISRQDAIMNCMDHENFERMIRGYAL